MSLDKNTDEVLGVMHGLEKKGRRPLKDLPGIDWHIINPLHAAGIFYVEQLNDMTVEQIANLVIGKRNLPKLMNALGRSEEYDRYVGNYMVEVFDDEGRVIASYALPQLKQIAGLAGTLHNFGFESKAELMDALERGYRIDIVTGEKLPFSWEDIARYKYEVARRRALEKEEEERRRREAEAERNARRQEMEAKRAAEAMSLKNLANNLDETAFAEQVERLVERYARDFDTDEFIEMDWDNLRIMAGMRLRVMTLQKILGSLDTAGSIEAADVAARIAGEIRALTSEIHRLEDALGVSLKARAKKRDTGDPVSAFMDFVRAAKNFIAREATIIRCPHCSEKGEGIRLALFVPHFPRHVVTQAITMVCPLCHQEFSQNLVTETQLADYIEADDFVPADMPPDLRAALRKRMRYPEGEIRYDHTKAEAVQ